VVQILAEEEIDMDNFVRSVGPDAAKRAENDASNPYKAAQYFYMMCKIILKTLFGIATHGGHVHTTKGLVGNASAYFGVVEAQGRGTLHLHMFMWLLNAPTADEMHELLSHMVFCEQV
jgi:Helitron helicase-like domain at N-terminus